MRRLPVSGAAAITVLRGWLIATLASFFVFFAAYTFSLQPFWIEIPAAIITFLGTVTLWLFAQRSKMRAKSTVASLESNMSEETRTALLSAARTRNQILSLMSHELRTSMNGVVGAAELLRRQPLNDEAQVHSQIILDSSANVLRIIQDTLDISRVEAGEPAALSETTSPPIEDNDARVSGLPEVEMGSKPHILIVDDNATNRVVAQALCEMFGCTSRTAEDGAQALEAVKARPFDLVLMDIKMPVMDGVEATLAIRALPGPERNIPIVGLSANADPDDARYLLSIGMAAVVEKPIKPELLRQAMNYALSAADNTSSAAAHPPAKRA